jgi:thiol-disulfide isomerase/thioredoxin
VTDVLVLLAVLAVTALLAAWWRARDGRVRDGDGDRFDRAAVGAPAGTTLLVEFTAPGCAPCERAKGVLSAAAIERPDVLLVTVDVGEHLDLARAHGILRAPTTLVIDAADRVRHRISGVPAAGDLDALLDGAEAPRAA